MGKLGKLGIFILFLGLCCNTISAQDTINKDLRKEKLYDEIAQRKWRVKLPVWVPGFTGTFAYGGIGTLPEGGGFSVVDRLEGEIGVTFYLIGDVQFRTKKWLFAADGFHTTLASNLKFQNIDKIEFPAAIDGTIVRGYAGFKIYEKNDIDNRLRVTIYPYGGLRYIDLRIYSEDSNILDLDPAWAEPILGVRGGVYYKRWLFEAKADIGGFSINNHWSGFAGFDSSYRFGKFFGLGLGWAFMHFNYDSDFDFKHLDLSMRLSGPVLSVEFYF